MAPGHTKAALSVEHWTWKPQRTLVSTSPRLREKVVPSPTCAASQAPAMLLPPRLHQTAGSAWAWHHPSSHLAALPLDPRINNACFPKCSNPCPKPYSRESQTLNEASPANRPALPGLHPPGRHPRGPQPCKTSARTPTCMQPSQPGGPMLGDARSSLMPAIREAR